MTKEQFRKLTSEGVLFLDGATGSNLFRAGMPSGVCPELWILEHKDIMIELQRAYAEAGSDIIYAPTFTANRVKLAEYGLEKDIRAFNHELTGLSKQAAGDRAFVAGDLTMTGRQLTPVGSMDLEELIDVYKEQLTFLAEAGIDLIVVETMMSLQETRAALIAAKETCPQLPVMATMTFEGDGRSLYGTDPVTAAVVLESLGADAVGANCSAGPDRMADIIRQMAGAVQIPVIAKPNAGLPSLNGDGQTVYDMGPEEFGEQMQLLAEAGAGVLGGCCGTTPEHIRALTRLVSGRKPAERKGRARRYLTSERQTVAFGLDDPFLIVGERINPTGKKKLQAELKEGGLDMVCRFAEEQEERGAAVLDVNMGMSGIDEKEMMLKALEELSGVTSLPLSLDSSHVDVLEAALRRYPGRALVNSVSAEQAKMERLLPIVKKYGAMFILLPLSDKGLPESQAEKTKLIETVISRALSLGMKKEDIVVDGLVTTVGANPDAALETLEAIRYCKSLGLATICGLSNISFGLPERSYINAAFLTMAIQAGLTMAIANPAQDILVAAAWASDLMLHKEESDIRYITFAGEWKERRDAQEEGMRENAARLSADQERAGAAAGARAENAAENGKLRNEAADCGLRKEGAVSWQGQTGADGGAAGLSDFMLRSALLVREAVLRGNRRNAEALTRAALEDGVKAQTLLNDFLLPAINEVGELFDRGKYFLPQLIASAETMKLSIGVLEPLLLEKGGKKEMPVVVIATVAGDIHDIGKNLVALMLKNHGFQVIDLGKDVKRETIIEAAVENRAQIIALSALMTTTMQEMRQVVRLAREKGVTAKIIIGGAVITQDYADEISADGYSRDAADAVKLAKRLVQMEQ